MTNKSTADASHELAKRRQWATIAGIGAIALWCCSGPCFAAGSRAIGGMPYLALSSLVGVITASIYHRFQGHQIRDLFTLSPRVAAASFFGVCVYTLLLLWAIDISSDGVLAQIVLVNYLWPVLIILLSAMLLPEKTRIGFVLAGAALGFAGIVISRGAETFRQPPSSLLPHAMALAGAFFWALYSVLLKRWRIPRRQSGATFGFLICAVIAAIAGWLNGEWAAMERVSTAGIFWVMFSGIGPVGLAYYWWEIGMKEGHAHLMAALAYFIPVVSALLVGLLFRESLSWWLLPGALMITAGAWIAGRAKD